MNNYAAIYTLNAENAVAHQFNDTRLVSIAGDASRSRMQTKQNDGEWIDVLATPDPASIVQHIMNVTETINKVGRV